jgi:hypothetical protein
MMKAGLSTRDPKLDQLQRWMQAVVTHPGGLVSGIASEEAQGSLSVTLSTLENIVAPSAKLSGAERLAIYCRSYHARLVQCFESMFPILLKFLGNDLFNKFALDYLDKHPPHSYTLNDLADGFAQHLAETRPDATAPWDQRERWPDFIIDLASIEWAFQKVYDGPGVEGQPVRDAQDLGAMPIESILASRPVSVPCLRLFEFRYPVHDYLIAASRGAEPEMPAPGERFVAMTRVNYRVKVYELTKLQYELLRRLDGDSTVAQALDRCAAFADSREFVVDSVIELLDDWVAKGLLATVTPI